MRITSALFNPALLDLPWTTPLEEWPADRLVTLPQGISRHVVRFVKLEGTVYAVKETAERVAQKEYDLLRQLERIDAPAVEAVAIVADRVDGTCSSPCRTGRCSPTRCARTPSTGCSTRWPRCWSGSI